MNKAKILVVDHEKEFLLLMQERLRAEGYDVATAQDGEEGLKVAKQYRPNLVICDIRMPKKDGYEFLRELRETVDKSLPVIIASVIDEFDKIKEAYKDDADFYITKPVELEKLSKNIRTILSLQKLRRKDAES